jgi:cytochrome c553
MKPVVDRMTADDILNVTAYVSSLPVATQGQPTAQR